MSTHHQYLSIAGYHAPLDVYMEMNWLAQDKQVHTLPADRQVNVCVGKEWYRYTSSFFMPDEKYEKLRTTLTTAANLTQILHQKRN